MCNHCVLLSYHSVIGVSSEAVKPMSQKEVYPKQLNLSTENMSPENMSPENLTTEDQSTLETYKMKGKPPC